MKPSKGFWVALGCGIAAVGIPFGLFVWLTPCNGFKQHANMRTAEEIIHTIQPQLAQEPRFAGVELVSYTGGKCGCLLVHGSVASDGDLAALKAFIDVSKPAVEVKYSVTLGDGGGHE